jgi:hypothetical protein
VALTIRRYSPPELYLCSFGNIPIYLSLLVGVLTPLGLVTELADGLCDAYIYGALTPEKHLSE